MSVNPKMEISRAERLFGKKDDSDRAKRSREREQEIIRQRQREEELKRRNK